MLAGKSFDLGCTHLREKKEDCVQTTGSSKDSLVVGLSRCIGTCQQSSFCICLHEIPSKTVLVEVVFWTWFRFQTIYILRWHIPFILDM